MDGLAAEYSPVFMGDLPDFIVRPLPHAGLAGAFRFHLTSKDLSTLGLNVGDLCQITSEDGSVGYGIAWRSTEPLAKPQSHPVRMSDSLRDAFGFKLGMHVAIIKAKTQIHEADQVSITEVRSDDEARNSSDNLWMYRCAIALGNGGPITSGITYEVSAGKAKRRYLIEQIDSTADNSSSSALYYVDDNTKVIIRDEPLPLKHTVARRCLRLDGDGIGGLDDQIHELNERLHRLAKKIEQPLNPAYLEGNTFNRGILIYGFEGTGKTLMLDRLAETDWCSVQRLQKKFLVGSATKDLATIQSIFTKALANQPSLILMDKLDKLVPTKAETVGIDYADILDDELRKLESTRVLVVGAARRTNDVDTRIIDHLDKHMELPVPDATARIDILKNLRGKSSADADPISEDMGPRTTSFTGRDLAKLVKEAKEHTLERLERLREAWIKVDGGGESQQTSPTLVEVDGASHSRAATIHEQQPHLSSESVIEDYDKALTVISASAVREICVERPNVQWSDIGGSEKMQAFFDRSVSRPLRMEARMRKAGLTPCKGVLLFGPPGCSKTLTARAVATSYNLNFIVVNGAEHISKYVGESEQAIRDIFLKARHAAPCVLFFDEVDAIAGKRGNALSGLNVVQTLLTEMDGFKVMKGVTVLAATNAPEMLDPAILRYGRFDKKVFVGPPDANARKEIIAIKTKPVTLASDVNIERLVAYTEDYTGAEVVQVCEDAMEQGFNRSLDDEGGNMTVTMEDFDLAVKRIVPQVTPEMLKGYKRFAKD